MSGGSSRYKEIADQQLPGTTTGTMMARSAVALRKDNRKKVVHRSGLRSNRAVSTLYYVAR